MLTIYCPNIVYAMFIPANESHGGTSEFGDLANCRNLGFLYFVQCLFSVHCGKNVTIVLSLKYTCRMYFSISLLPIQCMF